MSEHLKSNTPKSLDEIIELTQNTSKSLKTLIAGLLEQIDNSDNGIFQCLVLALAQKLAEPETMINEFLSFCTESS